MTNRAQLRSVEPKLRKHLIFFKVRGVTIENTLLLKYQKQGKKAEVNREDALMMLPNALGKS